MVDQVVSHRHTVALFIYFICFGGFLGGGEVQKLFGCVAASGDVGF